MEAVFIKTLNISLSAGWMILAVLVSRLALKKASRWVSVLLWGLVGLRLVMPFSLRSPLSLIPSAEVIDPAIGYEIHPAIHSGVPILDGVVNPVLGSSLAATPMNSVNPMQICLWLGGWIWVIGAGALVFYGLFSYLRLRKSVSEAVPYRENVLLCDRVSSPFILGVFLPRIYLPSDLGERDTELVLAHEFAHLRRWDHLWKPLGFLILAVHWFNPLVWIAYVLLCRDIEAACDEKVVSGMELADKKAYASALVSSSTKRRLVLACPLAFGEVGVKERVKGVLNYRKPAFWILAAALTACAVLAVCFLTDPMGPTGDVDQPISDPEGSYQQIVPAVVVNGKRFQFHSSGVDVSSLIPPSPRSSFDGMITSSVDSAEWPNADDQSNFGTDYGYKIIDEDRIAVYIAQEWVLFTAAEAETAAVNLDFGVSGVYSEEDMEEAVQIILTQFQTFKGCELHSLRYVSDESNSPENLAWMNELAEARGMDTVFTQCAEFKSDFHSPTDPALAGAWNVDEEYVDWGWWLAREEGGEWQLMTWGY